MMRYFAEVSMHAEFVEPIQSFLLHNQGTEYQFCIVRSSREADDAAPLFC